MEYNTEIHNTFHSLQDSHVAADILGAWRQAAAVDGVSRKRKVDDHRSLLGVGAMAGSGMPYPGVSRRCAPGVQNGPEYKEDNRKSPFNFKTKTKKS